MKNFNMDGNSWLMLLWMGSLFHSYSCVVSRNELKRVKCFTYIMASMWVVQKQVVYGSVSIPCGLLHVFPAVVLENFKTRYAEKLSGKLSGA